MKMADRLRSLCRFRSAERSRLSWATRITLVRILLIVPFIMCLLKMNDPTIGPNVQTSLRYAAIAVFLVMAVSDALDGYLARHYRQITRLGTFLDPVADKLLMTSACLLLASERGHVEGFTLPTTVVVAIVGKDVLIVIGFAVVYLVTSQIRVVPVLLGKAATALELVMVACVLTAPELSRLIPHYRVALSVLWWSAALVAILATLVYIRNGSRYIEWFEGSGAANEAAGSTDADKRQHH
jgi:CDP-diacylglycerol--glycerol-3-phosphate 3-phosphatidyltransferase